MFRDRKAPPGLVLRAKARTLTVKQTRNQESRKEPRKVGLGRVSEVGLTPPFHSGDLFFKHPDQSAAALRSALHVCSPSQWLRTGQVSRLG